MSARATNCIVGLLLALSNAALAADARVRPGIEEFLRAHVAQYRGKRLGLVTHPAGIDGESRSTLDLLARPPDLHLGALYGPEPGARGNAQAGEYVPFYVDEIYHLPVFSLYGQTLKPTPGMLRDLDESMRRFDTDHAAKAPSRDMVRNVDVLIIDLQDVGTRVYTYAATMAYCLQAAAELGIEVVVLDRPNPINGIDMEGPLLDDPALGSPVGLYPIPLRHGLTIGELARLFNGEFLERKAHLTVVPMAGWRRSMWFDQTGLPWVWPSPNMPTPDTATVYPGQVFFEGTNVSEGRGTTRPFETIGAPWIDGHALAERLNALDLPGVRFRECWFTPSFSKFSGQLCGGVQLQVTDRGRYRSFAVMLHTLRVLSQRYPHDFRFHDEYFDRLMGSARVRQQLQSGVPVEIILDGCEQERRPFAQRRRPYLLYD